MINLQALNTLTSSHGDLNHYVISHNQWSTLNKIAEFLEPFKDITIKMSTSLNSTAFWIIPLFNIIIDHVEDAASDAETKNEIGNVKKFDCIYQLAFNKFDYQFHHLLQQLWQQEKSQFSITLKQI